MTRTHETVPAAVETHQPERPEQAAPAKPRDWIAVDQMVTRLMNNAPDEFERDVVRLAAETSGGPDTEVAGGGEVWKQALASAREHLQAAMTEDLNDQQPETADITDPVRDEVADILRDTDMDKSERQRVRDQLVAVLVEHLAQARAGERHIIAEWLQARAEHMGRGGSVVVDAQARALDSAAERLRETVESAGETRTGSDRDLAPLA
jgi:hypothetical protein